MEGAGVCCLLDVPEGCSCEVNLLQCALEGVETVVCKYIRWKSVPLGYCSGNEAVFIIVLGGGCLSVFVWVVVCLCPGVRYWLGLMYKRPY